MEGRIILMETEDGKRHAMTVDRIERRDEDTVVITGHETAIRPIVGR